MPCSNCRFWDNKDAPESIGICRRYPPVFVGQESEHEIPFAPQFAFPLTYAVDWCAEQAE